MKRLLFKASLLALIVVGYIASPFVTVWSIREAARNGDSAYLEHKIDWPGVRASLSPTISRIALNLPDPDHEPLTKPGLWQRFKAYWGQGAVNHAIDAYITPEGLPKLFAARKMYRDYIAGPPDDSKIDVFERMRRFWARVKRAEFTSMTTFEIDVVDKHDPDRLYLGKLSIDGFGWKLMELRVKMLETAENAVIKFTETGIETVEKGVETVEKSLGQAPQGLWARAKAAAR